MTLLVATQNPNATAETYVRQHMRQIAPGNTVGLGLALEGEPPGDLPFISIEPRSSALKRRVASLLGRLRYGFSGAPVGARRAEIIAFIRRHEVKLIFAEFGPTGAALREIALSEGIPLIVNFHGFDATVMPRRRAIRSAYRLLARDAQGFVCGSRHFRQTLIDLGFPEQRIEVIPCGVACDRFRCDPKKTGRKLIAVGRLTAKKAPQLTLAAFRIALQSSPDLTIEIIGDGPLRPLCESFIAENGLAERATLRGALSPDEVSQALSTADIFVQHSIVAPNGDTESQGISLAEAMASALPVVATDHNGFRETVVHGETGFLVPEGDIEGMAQRIVELARDGDLRQSMGAAGMERVRQKFDDNKIATRLREYLGSFAAIR